MVNSGAAHDIKSASIDVRVGRGNSLLFCILNCMV